MKEKFKIVREDQKWIDSFFNEPKRVSIIINTEEEYYTLMRILEDNNFLWVSGHKPTEWEFKGEVILLNIFGYTHTKIVSTSVIISYKGTISGLSLKTYIQRYSGFYGESYSAAEFINFLKRKKNI